MHPLLALRCLHEGLLACRPCDRTVRSWRDVIDPAPPGVGRDDGGVARCAGRDHLAVIAAGDEAGSVACGAENAAAMHGDAALAVLAGEYECLLAEREHRR